MNRFNLPSLGSGIGLRHEHFTQVINNPKKVGWFEIITEDFLNIGGWAKEALDEIRKNHLIIPHGVGLSLGSTDPLDMKYLSDLKDFTRQLDCPWASDHLCYTMVDHINLEDLIPLPFTQEAIGTVVKKLKIVQDTIELPFLIENVTRYITVSDREMSEAEFITRILEQADCGLLLDVTNVLLNSKFHDFDPYNFITSLPLDRVVQIHLAGWEEEVDGSFIDSHDAPIPSEVWQLFEFVIKQIGRSSVLIERDANLPDFCELVEEAMTAERVMLASRAGS